MKDVGPNNDDLIGENVTFSKPELKANIRTKESGTGLGDSSVPNCSIVPHSKPISQFKQLADYPCYQIPYPE